MYLGLPLFPGVSQHNQLTRIIEMLGPPPDYMVEGKNGYKYFVLSSQRNSVSPVTLPIPPHSSPLMSHGQSHGQSHGHSQTSGGQSADQSKYRLKTAEEYAHDNKTAVPVLKKYLRYSQLDEIIMKCPVANKSSMTNEQKHEEMLLRKSFLNFLTGLFRLDPMERWTGNV
jgi:dual specificity protein kinase YAK1